MLSIVGIVAVLAALLLVRAAVRLWDRRIEAALELHLRRAREFATRVHAEREAAEHRSLDDALRFAVERGQAGAEP